MLGKVATWFAKAWAWFKKNWYWILLPIGVLIILARIFRRERPTAPVVVESKDSMAAADIAIHDNQTAAKVQEAEKATSEQIKKIEAEHEEILDRLGDSQRLEYEALKQKPAQEITNWLLKVGRGDA